MSGVSVIVPTHNRAAVLRDTLDHILKQTAPPLEIIVVDDGSTDETAEAIASYGAAVKGIRIERGKPAATRNAGAAAASGEWLLFTDDDCRVPPNWVEGMLAAAARRGADAVCGGIEAFSLETTAERYQHYRMKLIFGDRAKDVAACPLVNFLIRRDVFAASGGLDESLDFVLEDWEFGYRLRKLGHRIAYDPAVAVAHRYQRDWAAVVRRIEMTGADGIAMARRLGMSPHGMIVKSAAKWALCPLWSEWRYPRDLYHASLSVETRFFAARLRAYFVRSTTSA